MADTLQDAMRKLRKLGEKVQSKANAAAARKAATPINKEMKSRAKRLPSRFQNAIQRVIGIRRKKYQRGAIAFMVVGPRIFGKPIRNLDRKAGTDEMIEPGQLAEIIEHIEFGFRDIPARPFIRPAFESTKGQAEEIYKATLAAAVNREVRRLAAS